MRIDFTEYTRAGWVLVPLAPGEKAPRGKGWNVRELCLDREDETRSLAGAGLAHAYSGTCSVDIDDVDNARRWLHHHGVDLDALLEASDAVMISSGRKNRAKLIYALPQPLPGYKHIERIDGVKVNTIDFRCATRGGLTMQDVLPPTVHPDTGNPYEWVYGDELAGHWSCLPLIPDDLKALWQSVLRTDKPSSDEAASMTVEEIRPLLDAFDPDTDYESWITVGMAIHSATAGGSDGLALWDEWSAKGDKYKGSRDLSPHWGSFEGDGVTGAYLLMGQRASADDFEALPEIEEDEGGAPGKKKRTFEAVPVSEWVQRPPPQWLIHDFLPKADLAMVYGASGAGKSFLALDISMAIATGMMWRERDTVQGSVLWIAAEAAGSVRNRALAHALHNDLSLDEADLWIIGDTPNLTLPEDVRALGQVAVDIKPELIVVDTLSAAAGGANENSGEDMAIVLAACRTLHKITGALVMIVHHAGKDETRGARGWSGIKAAMQTEIEVRHEPTGERAVRVMKQRDGEEDLSFPFRLLPVALMEVDGKPQVSCAVEPLETVTTAQHNAHPGWHALTWYAIAHSAEESVTRLQSTVKGHAPDGAFDDPATCVDAAIEAACEAGMLLVDGDTYHVLEE